MMYDLFIEKKVHDDDLVKAIAELFNVDATDVQLLDDINKIVDYGMHPVTVERRYHNNGYEMFISIFTHNQDYEESRIAEKISRLVMLDVLYAAQSVNLYEWVKVSPNGMCSNVLLCDDPMDERGEAVLSKFAP